MLLHNNLQDGATECHDYVGEDRPPLPDNSYGLLLQKLGSCNLAYNQGSHNYDDLRCLEGVWRVSGGYIEGVWKASDGWLEGM